VAKLRSGESITSEQIGSSDEYPVFGGNGLRGYTAAYTHEGDFPLIGRQGALCGCVNFASGRFWASEHAVVAAPLNGHHSTWLFYVLSSMNLGQYSQSAAQPGLSVDVISNLVVPVPPTEQQRAIADFLDRETEKTDALVAKKQRLIELLQEKRTALINHAVTKGLDPDVPMKDSSIVSLGHVASHYDVRSFGRVASLQRGFDLPADDREAGVYPVVSSGGIVDTHSEGPVGGPGVVTGRYGSVGSVYWLESAFWPHNTALYVRDFWGNAPRFVYWLLLSLSAGIAAAESGKSAVPGLDQKDTRALQVAVPPLEEQLAIATHLDAETGRMNSLMDEVRRAEVLLHEYRSALITAAVTGQIDVGAQKARRQAGGP